MKLELVDYTYAETCNGEIRIHEDLQYFSKELFDHAMQHEIGHQGLTVWEDIKWDFKDSLNLRIHSKALLFYFKHPKLIIRMIKPVHLNYKAGVIEVNWVLVFIYFIYALITIYILYLI